MATYRLSKSKIMAFLQCPKRLYLQVHHPELTEESAGTEQRFATGHQVGEIARSLVPKGLLIGHDNDLAQALVATRDALEQFPKKTLFEATFQHAGVLIRADVLIPGKKGYRLREVKSSTEVKDQHIADCAVQAWVIEGAGILVSHIELTHVDKTFVYPGNGNYGGLLVHEDITDDSRALMRQAPGWAKDGQKVLAGKMPDMEIGDHCNSPYACPFIGYCHPEPSEYPVSRLPRAGKLANDLLDEGIDDIRDIPDDRLTNEKHIWVRRVTISGQAELDTKAGDILRKLSYPRYYLDFETINPAIPLWSGTRPYQHLPFQWSCHRESENGDIYHTEFLDTSGNAPMRAFAESLLITVGKRGPVLVYSPFESTRIKELAEMFPDLAKPLSKLRSRLVDLLPITQAHYYHPAMLGSWSIKSVLPTIAPELDYGNLEEVQDGGGAQSAYFEIIDPKTPEERRIDLTAALLAYCAQDTLALLKVAHFFQQENCSA